MLRFQGGGKPGLSLVGFLKSPVVSVGAGVGLCGVGTLASPASWSGPTHPAPTGDASVPTRHPLHSRPYKTPRHLSLSQKPTSERPCTGVSRFVTHMVGAGCPALVNTCSMQTLDAHRFCGLV